MNEHIEKGLANIKKKKNLFYSPDHLTLLYILAAATSLQKIAPHHLENDGRPPRSPAQPNTGMWAGLLRGRLAAHFLLGASHARPS
jgi:hypothetical protein